MDVRARVQGYIQEIAFKEGTVVKPGDLLLRIDPRPFEAAVAQEEADLAQTTATQEKTQLDEQRQNQLLERKINSQQDYDNAVKANLGAKAAVEAARLVLCAVFVPVAFMSGVTGQLYQQFALTIAVAVVFSAINALTLSPALCAILLKKPTPARGPLVFPSLQLRI